MNNTIIGILVVQGIALIVRDAVMRTKVTGLLRRTAKLEKDLESLGKSLGTDFVPRPEVVARLESIEKFSSANNQLLLAMIGSPSERGIAIKAIEARAASDLPLETEWLEAYVQTTLPQFEGDVAWMYLDSRGLVTIADGVMLPNGAAALQLPLRTPAGTLADHATVLADFNRVSKMLPDRLASFYRCNTSLTLTDGDRAALRRARVTAALGQLCAEFPGFESTPVNARLALVDMVYNLGLGRPATPLHKGTGLLGYTDLCRAIRTADWLTAANQCDRDVFDPAFRVRNHWTQTHFLAASQTAAESNSSAPITV